MNRRLFGPIFLFGFCVFQAQILLFREFLVLSYGNELALGGMLMIWLAGTGLGSIAGGRMFSKDPEGRAYFFLPMMMALLLLSALAILRLGPAGWGYSWGEMLSLPAWSTLALGALFPFCLVSGALFPYFGQLDKGTSSAWKSILGIFWMEALGSAAGGIAGLFLITWISGFSLAFLVNTGLAVCSFWLWRIHPGRGPGDKRGYLALSLILFSLVPIAGMGNMIDQRSREIQWRPFSIKMIQETPYGNLTLTERNQQYGFFLNGVFQFSSPDPRRAEEKTHLPLLSHPHPRTVLLVGGGLTGTLREILKHPMIEKVDFVELDPNWVKGVSRYIQEVRPFIRSHPKTNLLTGDGRQILKNERKQFDLILLDQPGPVSLQLNRFYTQEFFQLAKEHLNPGGLLVLILNGPSEMIGLTQAETFKSLFRTLQKVFPNSSFFPGEEISLLGFRDAPNPELTTALILRRLSERSLHLDYLNSIQIQSLFSSWRIGYFNRIMGQGQPGEINRDLRPMSFYNQIISDLSFQYPWLAVFFKWVGKTSVFFWLGFLLLLGGGIWIGSKVSPGTRPSLTVLISVGASGFSTMSLEMLMLILFQVELGVLYLEIGLLMALFMLGLAGGSYWLTSRAGFFLRSRRVGARLQCLFSLYFFLFLLGVHGLALWPEGLIRFFLYSMMIIGGGIGGAIYAWCSKVYDELGKRGSRTAGTLYGIDLLGASLASLGISFFCLPLFGVTWTLIGLMGINGLTAFFLATAGNLSLDKR